MTPTVVQPESRIESRSVAAGDRVKHEERLALCSRLCLGALHQLLRDAPPAGLAVNEELRDLGAVRLVRRQREDHLHRAD